MDNSTIIQKLNQAKALVDQSISELTLVVVDKKIPTTQSLETVEVFSKKIDFEMNERAFIKNYGKGKSGPKKFVLLLAYLLRGKIGEEKPKEEIAKHWNKLKSVLKEKEDEKMEYNSYYAVQAKTKNWVDSKKVGFYFLKENWIEIFSKNQK